MFLSRRISLWLKSIEFQMSQFSSVEQKQRKEMERSFAYVRCGCCERKRNGKTFVDVIE